MSNKMSIESKALKTMLANEKKTSRRANSEYSIAFQNNSRRGHVWNQSEINSTWTRDAGDAYGYSKVTHLHDADGEMFEYIVIKRHRRGGVDWFGDYAPKTVDGKNQLIEEIKCWEKYYDTEYSDYLCPMLKYFTSKSDRVNPCSSTSTNNVVIIAQRAVFVGTAKQACYKAEELNTAHGYGGTDAAERLSELKDFSDFNGWWDAIRNDGNSGVIFDYSRNCYKAVIIDYAL